MLANRIDSVGRHGINLTDRDAYHGDNEVGAVAIGFATGQSILFYMDGSYRAAVDLTP